MSEQSNCYGEARFLNKWSWVRGSEQHGPGDKPASSKGLLISLQHRTEAGGGDGGGKEEARENRGWSRADMRMSKK